MGNSYSSPPLVWMALTHNRQRPLLLLPLSPAFKLSPVSHGALSSRQHMHLQSYASSIIKEQPIQHTIQNISYTSIYVLSIHTQCPHAPCSLTHSGQGTLLVQFPAMAIHAHTTETSPIRHLSRTPTSQLDPKLTIPPPNHLHK